MAVETTALHLSHMLRDSKSCNNFCRNGQTQLSNEEPKIFYKCNGTMRING